MEKKFSPLVTLYRAASVILLTPEINQYLQEHDPKALEQLQDAINTAQSTAEISEYEYEKTLANIDPHPPYVNVEYDPEYFGGDYDSVGRFVKIAVSFIDKFRVHNQDERLRRAFSTITNLDPIHIIHYSFDELVDEKGKSFDLQK